MGGSNKYLAGLLTEINYRGAELGIGLTCADKNGNYKPTVVPARCRVGGRVLLFARPAAYPIPIYMEINN